jgi:hypothetical protein
MTAPLAVGLWLGTENQIASLTWSRRRRCWVAQDTTEETYNQKDHPGGLAATEFPPVDADHFRPGDEPRLTPWPPPWTMPWPSPR